MYTVASALNDDVVREEILQSNFSIVPKQEFHRNALLACNQIRRFCGYAFPCLNAVNRCVSDSVLNLLRG